MRSSPSSAHLQRRLAGRAPSALTCAREAQDLLELALLASPPAGPSALALALGARVAALSGAHPTPPPQQPQQPPRQPVLAQPLQPLPPPPPPPQRRQQQHQQHQQHQQQQRAGVDALRRALLEGPATRGSAPAAAPAAAELAALDEELLRLTLALRQGGQAAHDALATGNAALGATGALAERNAAAVGAAAGELTAGDRRALGYTCSLVGVVLQGVAAFLVAYGVMRVLPRPPPMQAHLVQAQQAQQAQQAEQPTPWQQQPLPGAEAEVGVGVDGSLVQPPVAVEGGQ